MLGTIGGVPVAVMQGRVHAYEGYAMEQVTFPTRVLGMLGCGTLIVTNAAGGIRADIPQGSLVAISDHINLTGTNAALGPNEPRFALRAGRGAALLRYVDGILAGAAEAGDGRGGAAGDCAERGSLPGGAGAEL